MNSAINASNVAQIGATSANNYSDMPNAADYYVDPNSYDYQRDFYTRIGDWFSGYDANARYQAAQQLKNYQYQDAYNKWQAQREDSQYQRAVEDLKKAGLNPWLAVQNGITGSTTGDYSSKTSSVKLDKKGNPFKDLLTSAIKLALFAFIVGK